MSPAAQRREQACDALRLGKIDYSTRDAARQLVIFEGPYRYDYFVANDKWTRRKRGFTTACMEGAGIAALVKEIHQLRGLIL